MLQRHDARRRPLERHVARHHLIEHDAQAVTVGRRIGGLPTKPLGRHILLRNDGGANACSKACHVEMFHAVEENARRREVAVDHPQRVRRVDGIGHLRDVPCGRFQRESARGEPLCQGAALRIRQHHV